MAHDPRRRRYSAERLRETLDDEDRLSSRFRDLLALTSGLVAVLLVALGVWLGDRINLGALAFGYSAVCIWLAVLFACAYAFFARRRLKARLDDIDFALNERRYAEQEKMPPEERRPEETVDQTLFEELERATEDVVEAFWKPLRPARWIAGLATALTLAAVGFAAVPEARGPASRSSEPASILGVSWVVEEPLLIQTPSSFRPPQRTALVALRVHDPEHPDCAGEYDWRVTGDEGIPVPIQMRARSTCGIAVQLVPEQEYDVSVIRDEPSGGSAEGKTDVRVGELLVASFGDSVASGEGNPGPSKPRWTDKSGCNRSSIAGPRQAAQLISAASDHSRVVFFHLACTGAWIDGVGAHPSVLPQFGGGGNSQIEKLQERYGTNGGETIILLTVGANDIGFGPIVRFCLFHRRCFEKKLARTNLPLDQLVARRLSKLRGAYERLGQSRPFVGARVFVSEYFDPLHNERGELCRVLVGRFGLGMSREEAAWAERSILLPLNAIIREQAIAHKWVLVGGAAKAFRKHGYCARPSWIVHIARGLWKRNKTGPFHPNALGQEAYGRLIFQAVKPYLPA